jgi:hypothetical protein
MVAVVVLLIATSGCSLREVQLYFQFKGHPISTDQAKVTADLVNRNRPAGCDSRYVAGASYSTQCVPNNVTSVHCAGTPGDGPAVRGPLTLTGWDAFGLDPDSDGQACVDPVGNVDVMGQVLDQVEVAGWAFDPNTTDPINVDVYDNADGTRFAASDSRTDIGAAFPGAGDGHGFDVEGAEDIGTTHKFCAYGINVGAGGNQLLSCKTITMQNVGQTTWVGEHLTGLIEGADRVPGGVHIRGFIVDDTVPGTSRFGAHFTGSPTETREPIYQPLTVVRDDVADAFDQPDGQAYGFDFVQSTSATSPNQATLANATQVCLYGASLLGPSASTLMMCRPIDS